ncbi:uncharacterized protein LOC143917276 [Arctopsyche grandis]|uniref:uncharacterized protein LOC143917276 n=1 Tax=Arctopsyche grandis TaxID=121162 RepID=UPI00406D7C5F
MSLAETVTDLDQAVSKRSLIEKCEVRRQPCKDNRHKVYKTTEADKYGRDYENYITMLFILRGMVNHYKFEVGVEVSKAMKFDDLIFIYESKGKQYYRCLQAKHSISKRKNIDLNKLMTDADGDFSLVRYFFSYKDLVEDDFFSSKTQKDLIVFTNIPLNLDCVIGEKMVERETWQRLKLIKCKDRDKDDKVKVTLKDLVELMNSSDDILDVKNEKNRYKFNDFIIPTLKTKVNDFNVTRVARKFIGWLLKEKQFEFIKYIIQPYWRFLIDEVIDIASRRFYLKFLIGCDNISHQAKLFRARLASEINRRNAKRYMNKKEMTMEDLNKAVANADYPDWINSDKVDFNEVIGENEIKLFLKQLVFAVGQPDHEALKAVILEDLVKEQRKRYNNDDTYTDEDFLRYGNEVFEYFSTKLLSWKGQQKEKDETFLDNGNGDNLLDNHWEEMKYGIDEPIISFTGRDEELKKLHKDIKRGPTVESQIRVICGLPGIGKSELVKRYVQKYSRRFENKIIWIDGKSEESLKRSFRKLAENLKISMLDENNELKNHSIVMSEVYEKFSGKRCLLIFDDVYSQEVVESYMPPTSEDGMPFVIITSSTSQWKPEKSTNLNVLSEKDAEMLIKYQLNITESTESRDVETLAKMLGYFPLALQQFAAFILQSNESQTNKKFKVSDCIKILEKNSAEILSSKLPKNVSSYYKTTYDSFKNIIEEISKHQILGIKALDVLSIMSYLAPDDISIHWFSDYTKEELGEIIELLKKYSIVRTKSSHMSIHKLGQQVIRFILKQNRKEQNFLKKSYELLKNICVKQFGYVIDDYITLHKLVPHLEITISHLQEFEKSCSNKAISGNITIYLIELLKYLSYIWELSGELKKVKVLLTEILDMKRKLYGHESIEVLFALFELLLIQTSLYEHQDQIETIKEIKTILNKITLNMSHVLSHGDFYSLDPFWRDINNFRVIKEYSNIKTLLI